MATTCTPVSATCPTASAAPWPSVARDDPPIRATGHYWRGGVWVPTAYVSARALAHHGYGDLAHDATIALLRHMARTHAEYEPATIWEAYAPVAAAPSTAKDDVEISRPDFCGWSALSPISMLIEHVLGFGVDAPSATVRWQRHTQELAGIGRLRCGPVTCDVVATGSTAAIDLDGSLTLVIDGATFRRDAGAHSLSL